ncbi:MAG: hypothetical protein KGJ82_03665 [Nitrospirota bacterium]|nr:hypothetical protein [Nitrospirota bacterium]
MTQAKQKQTKPTKQAKLPRAIADAVKEAAREARELVEMPIVAMAPLEGGTQTGKRILTLADGTKAIFKPASGEVGHNKRKTE